MGGAQGILDLATQRARRPSKRPSTRASAAHHCSIAQGLSVARRPRVLAGQPLSAGMGAAKQVAMPPLR